MGSGAHFRGGVSVGARRARGFTLLELLVVVSIISILMGILLPALRGSRDAARTLACASTQRTLALGVISYATDELEWIPGYATSGRSLWYRPTSNALAAIDKRARAPVQVNDWMSPSLRDERLPARRDERFYTLLERFADPAMNERVPIWIGGGDAGNASLAQWIRDNNKPPAHGISYMMPANFQLFGSAYERTRFVTQDSSAKLKELQRAYAIPASHTPQITRVGAPARKIMFADAFRYLDSRRVDFDASYSHQNWGSFSERSACDVDSRSWGRLGGGGTSWNIPLVYRHTGRMNAAFYDGHIKALDLRQSRDPVLWAPSGSIIQHRIALEPDVLTYGYNPSDPARAVLE